MKSTDLKSEERVILHCDMNSFFANCELLSRPDIAHLPVAVCGNPESRHGIILAKNQPAKEMGVITAETIWQAKKKCPNLILLPCHHKLYKEISTEINKIYYQFTDMVEPFSIDESWLDVTGSQKLFGSGLDMAKEISNRIKKNIGLTLSIGVSYNKFFAKMGSEYKKPDAITLITRENFRDLLWNLNIEEMFFVGKASAEKLQSHGIATIGHLAKADSNFLRSILGSQGEILKDYALGLDTSPVARFCERSKIKSVGNSITFSRNLISKDDVITAITALSDTVSTRLRSHNLKAYGIRIEIKDPDFKIRSKQKTFDLATDSTFEIKRRGMEVAYALWGGNSPIRLISLTAIGLTSEDQIQLNFFNDISSVDSDSSLNKAMDKIREKYGSNSVSFGQLLNNDIGIDL